MLVDAAADLADTFEPPLPVPSWRPTQRLRRPRSPPPAMAAASRANRRTGRRGTCPTLTHVSVPANAASGFARAPGAYERTRPGYPAAAVAWLCEQLGIRPGARVCDLGAGTGKLTRLLVPSGAELVAIEPLAEMRAELGPGAAAGRRPAGPRRGAAVRGREPRRDHRRPGVPLVRRAGGARRGGAGAAGRRRARTDLVRVGARRPADGAARRARPGARAAGSRRERRAARPVHQPCPRGRPLARRLSASGVRGAARARAGLEPAPGGGRPRRPDPLGERDRRPPGRPYRAAALADAARLADTLGDEVELAYRTAAYAWRRRPR